MRFSMRSLLSALLLVSIPASAAVVNVKSRGARGNGTADDTAAINRAIGKSAPGDTVFFPAGTYRIADPKGIALQPDRTYKGDPARDSVLLGPGGYSLANAPWDGAVGITVTRLVFDGGGLRFDGSRIPAEGVSVTECTFRNIVGGGDNWTTHIGIFLPNGAEHSHFDRNTFRNIFTNGRYGFDDSDATAVFAGGLAHSTVDDNTFDYLNEGVHVMFDHTGGADVEVARNRFTRVHRITMEFQHDHVDGLTVRDNSVTDPLNPYWLTYGMSVMSNPGEAGRSTVVENNTVVANMPLDLSVKKWNYYPYGIEVAGTNAIVAHNRVIGLWGTGIGVGPARNIHLQNNLVCGKVTSYGKSIDQYLGPQPGTVLAGNTISPACPAQEQALMTPHSAASGQ